MRRATGNELKLGKGAAFVKPLAAHSPGDVGYRLSVELSDGRTFTAYYFPAEDGTVHAAATTWQLEVR